MIVTMLIPMTSEMARRAEGLWPVEHPDIPTSVLRWPELNEWEQPESRTEIFPLFPDELANAVQEAIRMDAQAGFKGIVVISRSEVVYRRLRWMLLTGLVQEVRIHLAHSLHDRSAFTLDEYGGLKSEDEARWPKSLFSHDAQECARLIRATVARRNKRTESPPTIPPREVRTQAVLKYDERLRATGTTRADGQDDGP